MPAASLQCSSTKPEINWGPMMDYEWSVVQNDLRAMDAYYSRNAQYYNPGPMPN